MKYIMLPLSLLVVLSACRWKVTKQSLKHGDVLKSNVEGFEKNRLKLSEKVITSIETAERDLRKEGADLGKISKDWEKEWTQINNRYDKLKLDFENVGSSSQNYFDQLEELSTAISDQLLRNDELGKNRTLRSKWEKSYKEAAVSVVKITEVLNSGKDFHMVLVASSIRQKLESNVDELKVISARAKVLLSDLETFTEAGRQLVEG